MSITRSPSPAGRGESLAEQAAVADGGHRNLR